MKRTAALLTVLVAARLVSPDAARPASETMNVGNVTRTTAVCNQCGGSCTFSTMDTQNNAGYGCFEGNTGGGGWEECRFEFTPSASVQTNTYQIVLRWRGGEDGSCSSVDGREFDNGTNFWNFSSSAWGSDFTNGSHPPFSDGSWAGPNTYTLCSSKSACTPYYRSSPKGVWVRVGDNDGGFTQNQDGIEFDLVQLDVYYDPTAPSVSWISCATPDDFTTYNTDGNACARLSVSDSGGSGLAASNYCYVRHKTNGSWVADGWVGENGYECTSTAGDNQYIQCDVYCEDQVNNTSSTVSTTNSLVDLNNPSSSTPTVDNAYFSPDASTGVKDTATVTVNPTDSASGVDCVQFEVKDSTGATHVRWHTGTSCGGDTNYAAWISNPTTWAWNGRDDASAQVSEGTYRIYVKAEDKAGRFSPATGGNDQQTCAVETITYGSGVAGSCASTASNDAVYRDVDEQNVAANETEVAYAGTQYYGTVNSGTYASTQTQNSVDWDWNEGCSGIWPFLSCYLDFDLRYDTDVPETTVTALRLQTRYKTQDDNIELWWYNYDTAGWSDRGTGVPAGQSAYATFNYDLCVGAMGVCNAWVSSGGTITPDWYDEESACCEDSDFYKVDYQHVLVEYNERRLDVDYRFDTTQPKSAITSVDVQTDAYSGNESFNIYKWNYTSSSWVATGYSTPSTEPASPQTVPICNAASCTDYITDAGATRQVKLRYLHTILKDGTVNRLKIDYQKAIFYYGSNWVQTVVDRTVPTTTDNWTDNWTAFGTVSITLTPSDNLSGVEWTKYCVDTTNSCDPTTGTTGTNPQVTCASGSICTQYVRYTSRDNAGNTGATGSKRVRQDLQAPTTTDNWTDNWTATSPVTVTLSPSDGSGSGLAATYYCVDTADTCSPATSISSPWNISVSCGAGSVCTQYVRYRSTDNVGNGENTRSERVRQDRQAPPTIGTVTPANTATATHVDGTYDLSTTFDDGSGSGVASCQYTVNGGGAWTNATWSAGTCSVTGLTCTDGTALTLNMRAYDGVSNLGTASQVSRTCDTVAPTGGALTYTDGYESSTPLTITVNYGAVSDARSGPATYVLKYDSSPLSINSCTGFSGSWTNTPSQPASTAAGSIDYAATTANCYKFQYVLTDNVGNSTTVTSTSVTKVDTTAPTAAASLTVVNSGSKTLKLTWTDGSDAQSGLQKHVVYRCSAAGTNCAPSVVNIDPTGSNPCYDENDANCTDAAGAGTLSVSPTRYCYFVRAVNNAGTDDGNSTAACRTPLLANEDVTAAVSGFPASASNSLGFYVGSLVAENVGNGRLSILKADGTREAGAYLDFPAGATSIVGAPYWANEGTENVAYVATSSGNLYKLRNTDGGTLNDPAGNTLCFCDPAGANACDTCAGSPAWASAITLNSCGGAANVTATTAPTSDANVVCFSATDSDCAAGSRERIYCVETNPDSVSAGGGVQKVVDVPGCGTQLSSELKIVTNAAWAATNIHVGSDCPGAANNVKLYRINADGNAIDCAQDFTGNDIQSWITGSFNKLFFATIGTGRAIHVATNSESAGACGTTVYAELSNFPYTASGTIGTISEGCAVHWTGDGDEIYCAGQDGKLYCVCQDASAPCTGSGAQCTGFPKTLESGGAKLRSPLIKGGTVYVLAENGDVWAVEGFSENTTSDDVAAASGSYVGCGQGYGQTAATTFNVKFGASNIASTLAYNSSASAVMVGTDNGMVFYLPLATSTCP